VAFANETYELNLKSDKYENYTRNVVGRSFDSCLRSRLLSGCAMGSLLGSLGIH
jgi:hypothetical protein